MTWNELHREKTCTAVQQVLSNGEEMSCSRTQHCAHGQIGNCDLVIKSLTLYQLSYLCSPQLINPIVFAYAKAGLLKTQLTHSAIWWHFILELLHVKTNILLKRKTKTQISFAVTAKSDQRLYFRYLVSTIPLFPESEFPASSNLQRLYSLVCVRPGQNPNCWLSHAGAHSVQIKTSYNHSTVLALQTVQKHKSQIMKKPAFSIYGKQKHTWASSWDNLLSAFAKIAMTQISCTVSGQLISTFDFAA